MRSWLLLLGAVGLVAAEPAVVRDLGIPERGVNWGRLHAGATAHGIFRIKTGTCEVERIWQQSRPTTREGTVWLTAADPEAIDVAGPIIGNELFFATGWRLRALTLPGEK